MLIRSRCNEISVLEPPQANWINDLYNYLTVPEGNKIIDNGWEAVYITKALKKGQGIDPLAPFASIYPLSDESETIDFVVARSF